MFTDGFTIGGKHSFADYGLSVKKRQLGFPKKNSIRKTVPFMSGYYDFTKINGGVSWGERSLSYTFDIIGNTPAEVDAECTRILNWLANVHDEDIFDDTMAGYHLHGSFESASPSESEDGEHTELTVTFVCYPCKISNAETVAEGYRGAQTKKIVGQPIRPTIDAVTDGRWYYRPVGEGTEANRWSDFYAGKWQSPVAVSEGEYVFGYSPNNQLVAPWFDKEHEENGITFTVNSNGTITINGTATATAWFHLRHETDKFLPSVGNYRLQGCPTGGGTSTYRLQSYVYNGEGNEAGSYYDYGSGSVITVGENTEYVTVVIRVASGYTANNLVIEPALYGKVKMTWNEEVL